MGNVNDILQKPWFSVRRVSTASTVAHRQKRSACTFVYSTLYLKYTYALFIDKSWGYQDGKLFFLFPSSPSLDGIFLSGEWFHPRTLVFNSNTERFNIASRELLLPPLASKHRGQEQLSKIENLIPKGLFQSRQELDKAVISMNDDYLAGIRFANKLSELIAQCAKVVQKSSEEEQSLLSRQERASHIWFEEAAK
jgi:hypothetical protein